MLFSKINLCIYWFFQKIYVIIIDYKVSRNYMYLLKKKLDSFICFYIEYIIGCKNIVIDNCGKG